MRVATTRVQWNPIVKTMRCHVQSGLNSRVVWILKYSCCVAALATCCPVSSSNSGVVFNWVSSVFSDPDDPEYVRQLRRPAEVKEDLNQMQERSRVTRIMKSAAFREELEEIVTEQLRSGPHPASLLALRQISELILPQAKAPASVGGQGRGDVQCWISQVTVIWQCLTSKLPFD